MNQWFAPEGTNETIYLLKASTRGYHRFARCRTAILLHCGKPARRLLCTLQQLTRTKVGRAFVFRPVPV